ncbi:hypothetical protein ACU4GA_21220 [Methylobacterium oryzae CBMB20]
MSAATAGYSSSEGTNRVLDRYRGGLRHWLLLRGWTRLIKARARRAEDLGIRCLHVIVPEKLSVYDDKTGRPALRARQGLDPAPGPAPRPAPGLSRSPSPRSAPPGTGRCRSTCAPTPTGPRRAACWPIARSCGRSGRSRRPISARAPASSRTSSHGSRREAARAAALSA